MDVEDGYTCSNQPHANNNHGEHGGGKENTGEGSTHILQEMKETKNLLPDSIPK